MSELNLPPFYVGQKVVCLVDGRKGKIKKGAIVTVLGIKFCHDWRIHIGQMLDPYYTAHVCHVCRGILSKTEMWPSAIHFAPIEENFQSISLEKVMEKETPLISVN